MPGHKPAGAGCMGPGAGGSATNGEHMQRGVDAVGAQLARSEASRLLRGTGRRKFSCTGGHGG